MNSTPVPDVAPVSRETWTFNAVSDVVVYLNMPVLVFVTSSIFPRTTPSLVRLTWMVPVTVLFGVADTCVSRAATTADVNQIRITVSLMRKRPNKKDTDHANVCARDSSKEDRERVAAH